MEPSISTDSKTTLLTFHQEKCLSNGKAAVNAGLPRNKVKEEARDDKPYLN